MPGISPPNRSAGPISISGSRNSNGPHPSIVLPASRPKKAHCHEARCRGAMYRRGGHRRCTRPAGRHSNHRQRLAPDGSVRLQDRQGNLETDGRRRHSCADAGRVRRPDLHHQRARPKAPVYAIRETATGDITLADGATSNAGIAWSAPRDGGYMCTPLVYRGLENDMTESVLSTPAISEGTLLYRTQDHVVAVRAAR